MHLRLRDWSTSNMHVSWRFVPAATHARIADASPDDDTPPQAAGTRAIVTAQDVPALGTCR